MAIPSRIKDRIFVVSPKKQANYATVLPDVDLQAGKRVAPNGPVFGQPEPRYETNRNQAYKGDYVTRRDEAEREVADQLSFDCDTFLLGWLLAFAMGKVTTTQPNAGGNPTAYQHVIKPLDPGTDGKDKPVTTIYTEVANAAALKRRLHSCSIREIGIEFPAGNMPLQLSASFVGSGQITTGALSSPPAMFTQVLLRGGNMQFLLGAQGGPTDITSEIAPGSVRFGFSWPDDDELARHPGSGLYRGRSWVGGDPQISFEFQRLVDDSASSAFDEWIAGTVREIKAIITGAQIGPGPETHKLELRFLAVKPDGQRLGQAGDKSVYGYSIGPDAFLKEGSNDVVTATVINTQASYFA